MVHKSREYNRSLQVTTVFSYSSDSSHTKTHIHFDISPQNTDVIPSFILLAIQGMYA